MAKFRIVVETGSTKVLAKQFEAETLEKAIEQAEGEAWEGKDAEGWEEIDTNTSAEVREELCEEVKDE